MSNLTDMERSITGGWITKFESRLQELNTICEDNWITAAERVAVVSLLLDLKDKLGNNKSDSYT